MKVTVLASGSKGNAILFESADSKVLVDQGISTKQATLRLASLGVAPESIDAIVITHEHRDHCAGIDVWRRKYSTPIFINRKTLNALAKPPKPIDGAVNIFGAGEKFSVGKLQITVYPITHDAADPVGVLVESAGRRIGLATDLGHVTELVRHKLADADALVVESNHDMKMLIDGRYPWELKDRIRSKHGHLSNDQACDLLRCVAHKNLKAVVLAHLSEENNLPELAMKSAQKALNGNCSAKIIVAMQRYLAETVRLD